MSIGSGRQVPEQEHAFRDHCKFILVSHSGFIITSSDCINAKTHFVNSVAWLSRQSFILAFPFIKTQKEENLSHLFLELHNNFHELKKLEDVSPLANGSGPKGR